MKNALNGLIRRLDMAEERIKELKDRSIESSQTETQKGKTEKEKCTLIMSHSVSLDWCVSMS